MREEPRRAPRAAKVDFRPLHLLRRNALVSAMLKPTLTGSAARADTVARWTTANKIASGAHKTARRAVADIG
jgi:hypothetical protein